MTNNYGYLMKNYYEYNHTGAQMRGLKSPNEHYGDVGTKQNIFLTQHGIHDIIEQPHIQNLPVPKP